MSHRRPVVMSGVLVLISSHLPVVTRADTVSSSEVLALLRHPPREYCTAPLWVWNDRLTDQQIVSTLRDLAGQNVRQVFVHPRPGLMTPYLSDEWFHLWKVALTEAERLDMNVWIYDENSYPSGFAGGLVPEAMPDSRGQGLMPQETEEPPKWSKDAVAVFKLTGDGYENVTSQVRDGAELPKAKYLTFSSQWAAVRPWFGGKFYVSLLKPGVVDKFIEITLEAYRREIGEHFGKRVPGVFTDEPLLLPAGKLPWTETLPGLFEKRWGYSLTDNLACLATRLGDWKRVRQNYFQFLNELFIERWGRPMHDWCEKHGLEFTGHYWEHDWPFCLRVPDNMAMYAWHQRPAIDTLMNDYHEDVHAQFGNVRAVLELASVANQLGKKRTLCEAYGAGGWDLRFEDMKRIADWLYVLGVNTLDEHLSYITIRGARKRDHPQSFSYHEPWWDSYRPVATYVARLSAALSHGEQVNQILVIEPTTTAWIYNTPLQSEAHLRTIGNSFQELVTTLAQNQVEFDLGCEDIIGRHGSIADNALVVGRRRYTTVVLPPHMENLNAKTMALIVDLVSAGGTVYCCGDPPSLMDGSPCTHGAVLASQPNWRRIEPDKLAAVLLRATTDGFAINPSRSDAGILYHNRRQLDDGELLFLVNTSLENASAGSVTARAGGVEKWDLHTGESSAIFHERTNDGVRFEYDLPAAGSMLVFLPKERRGNPPTVRPEPTMATIAPAGPLEIRRLDLNVLTLDYIDVTAGGETKEGLHFFKAAAFVFAKHGLEANPWDRAVQLRDQLITKTFPADSGFEASYRFAIRKKVPSELKVVIERADAYAISCNGTLVTPAKGQWWLDKSFGVVDVASVARVGENVVTIKASPFKIFYELESAYVIGDFSIEPADEGFVITPARALQAGPWNEQGLPLYGHRVAYLRKFNVSDPVGQYRIELPAWYGSVARVTINGTPAGAIWHQPWQCDVTDHLRAGTNEIEVIVVGTLKNTLGPHHGQSPLGRAWPSGFLAEAPETGPPAGATYSTVGYGLMEPFVLRQVTEP